MPSLLILTYPLTLPCISDNIKVADISDMIAGRPEEEALQSFSHICKSLEGQNLTELDISDNALGEKGVNACKKLLMGHDLQVTDLSVKYI
jgi:Ran GTPase-activating protein (RanGAP) involved in mRNA processing and transport